LRSGANIKCALQFILDLQGATGHRNRFDPERIRAHVEPFDRKYFKERMRQLIETNWKEFCRTRLC